MESQYTFLIILVAMVGLMFFTQRSQKKQAEKRMESTGFEKTDPLHCDDPDYLPVWQRNSRSIH